MIRIYLYNHVYIAALYSKKCRKRSTYREKVFVKWESYYEKLTNNAEQLWKR